MHSRQKEPLALDLVTPNAPAFELKEMHWGFPQYQKKGLLINARAETALERRTFCDSVRHRRCIIPAKHFYEWDSDKNKVTFFREDRPILFMAGFYNWFQNEECFMILTTQANASVSPVHNRMPVVLDESKLEVGFMMISSRNTCFIKFRQSFGGNRNMSSKACS